MNKNSSIKKIEPDLLFTKFKLKNNPFPVIRREISKKDDRINQLLFNMIKNNQTYPSELSEFLSSIKKRKNNFDRNRQMKDNKKYKGEGLTSDYEKKDKEILINEQNLRTSLTNKIHFGGVDYISYKVNKDDTMNKYLFEKQKEKIFNSTNFIVGLGPNQVKIPKIHSRESKKNLINNIYVKIKEKSRNPEDFYSSFKSENNIRKQKVKIFNFSTEKNIIKNKIFPNERIINNYESKKHNKYNLTGDNENFNFDKEKNINITKKNETKNYRNKIGEFNIPNNIPNLTVSSIDENDKIKTKDIYFHTLDNYKKNSMKRFNSNNNSLNYKKDIIRKNVIYNNDNLLLSTLCQEISKIKNTSIKGQKQLYYISKKKSKIRGVEKIINKNKNPSSISDMLYERRRKNKKENIAKDIEELKEKIKVLSSLDKIKKFTNLSIGQFQNINKEYRKKCKRIGISNSSITFNSGKIYRPSPSPIFLNKKTDENCEVIDDLVTRILIEKYDLKKIATKVDDLMEKMENEKINLTINIKGK